MSPVRKIGLILLCIIAAVPLFMSPAFLAGRVVIRKTMLSRLKKSELQTLSIPVHQLKWYSEGHELLVDGRMFDVKSIQLKGSNFDITGLFDDDETELNNLITLAAGNNHQESGMLLFKSCLGLIAVVNKESVWPTNKNLQELVQLFPAFVCRINDGYITQYTPPPDSLKCA
jgi:hypothetical protein